MLVLKDIRSFNKHVPVLILTSRDALEDRLEGLNSEADDYVMKPFQTDELVARIRALLRRPDNPSAPSSPREIFPLMRRHARSRSGANH